MGCLFVFGGFYGKGDQVLQASRGKGADHKPGKETAEAWAQLRSSVLSAAGNNVLRIVENPIALGMFTTLWEFALVITPLPARTLVRIPAIVNLRIHEAWAEVRTKYPKVEASHLSAP
jgi:hypothetical protein